MKKQVEEVLKKAVGEGVLVERAREGYGDYATNIAFSMAKKEGKNPLELAEEIRQKIDTDLFSKVEVKGGFVNFFLADDALWEEMQQVLKQGEDYGREESGKTVLIDYSSPNIAKSFGVGHLRSTIIGQSLYNIYSFLGWNTVGVNHLGDWGTQYGKLLYQIKAEGKDPEKLSIKELEQMYVRFHQEAEQDEAKEEEGRKWFAKLEKGDEEARKIWEICRKKSLEEFNRIYEELEIKIDYVLGESFYEDKLEDVIKEAVEKEVAIRSEGALMISFDDMPPAMIEKSDGSTTYLTRDLAAAKYRLKEFSPDLLLYEIGADQTLHMKQLFRAVEKMGWSPAEKFVHIAHGMFRLEDGKFSTRKGKTVHLEEVLRVAKEKALEMIELSATEKDMSGEEKEKTARLVGVGAVKYNDLMRHHRRDVVFDWERVITLKGNSGPYLQYTCVRCQSILQKDNTLEEDYTDLSEKEHHLLRRIAQFKETVHNAQQTNSPNVIADYAYSLAKEFNAFYDESMIAGNPQRVSVTKATHIILKQCLHLLTISVPEKM